jgi:NADPH:quinone reductase-like Zn-dependent oxidoreductase
MSTSSSIRSAARHSTALSRYSSLEVSSCLQSPDQDQAVRHRVRGVFVLVTVTTAGLTTIADLLDAGQLTTNVGEVLSFAEARLAHAILAGKPHKRGKIVLMLEA